MGCHETAVQLATFLLEHTHNDLDACVTQHLHPAARHLDKGV